MKTIVTTLVTVLLLQCIADYSFATDILVDFEDANVVQADFEGLKPGVIKPNEGRAGSSAIGHGRYVYKSNGFDFSKPNTSITVSTFFHLANDFDPPKRQMNFEYGEVSLVKSPFEKDWDKKHAFVSFGIRHDSNDQLNDYIFGGSQAAGGSFPGFERKYPAGTFKPGAWYQMKVIFSNLGTKIRYEIVIKEMDAEGVNPVETVVESTETNVDAAGLTKDQAVYAGFYFNSPTKVADDFSISQTE